MELKTPASPPERFLRGRQKQRRPTRRIGKLLLKSAALVFALASLVAALVMTVTVAGRAPELAVHHVLVEGNEQLSDGEILELLDFSEHANILMLDLEEVRAKLLLSAWVAEVEVERILPSTLKLVIRERLPVAVAVLDDLYLLASDGTMLDQLSPRYHTEKLILARGLRDGDGLVPERAALAGRLSAELITDERLADLVSELDVRDGRDSVRLLLRAPALTALVDGDTMIARLREVVPLLGGIERHYAELAVVDLRFKGRAYLRLRAKNTQAAFASGGAPF